MRIGFRALVGLPSAVFCVLVCAGLFAVAAPAATAATVPAHALSSAHVPAGPHAVRLGRAVAPAASPATPTTAPGTNLNQQVQQADSNQARKKAIVAVVVVVLLVIVYFGHRAQRKHKVKVKNLQNAKG